MLGCVTLTEFVEKLPRLSFSVTLAVCNPAIHAGINLPVLVKKLQPVNCASADHSRKLSKCIVQVSGTPANCEVWSDSLQHFLHGLVSVVGWPIKVLR